VYSQYSILYNPKMHVVTKPNRFTHFGKQFCRKEAFFLFYALLFSKGQNVTENWTEWPFGEEFNSTVFLDSTMFTDSSTLDPKNAIISYYFCI
jgi:hypothetical protein